MSERMTWGALSIDGVPVGPIVFKADLKHALVGELGDAPIAASYEAKFEISVESTRSWRAFMRAVGASEPLVPPLYDMTVWGTLDPSGAWMPVVNVDAHTEVVTRCQRGGGYLGRTWRAVPIDFELEGAP